MINEELGADAKYFKNGGINLTDITRLGVYQYPDRYHCEDLILASYNGIPYELCDYVLEERHVSYDKDGRRRVSYEKYFGGRVIKIDFKRDLSFKMKVIEGYPRGLNVSGYQKLET